MKPLTGTKINLEVQLRAQIVISDDEKVKNMPQLKERLFKIITQDFQPLLFRHLKKSTPELTFMGVRCGILTEPQVNVGYVRNSTFYGTW